MFLHAKNFISPFNGYIDYFKMNRKTCRNKSRYKVFNKYAYSVIAAELTNKLIGLVYYKYNGKGCGLCREGFAIRKLAYL